ncbi:MAG: GNAT family N-acetyltransferase [Owenweeksia sp.]
MAADLHFKVASEITPQEKQVVMELWNKGYPVTIRHNNLGQLEEYLQKLKDVNHYLLYDQDQLIGWMPVFLRDDDRWFALLIRRKNQGRGLGRQLLNFARKYEKVLNGWVVDREGLLKADGELYRSPLDFYVKNGFTIIHEVRLETPQLSSVKVRWSRCQS